MILVLFFMGWFLLSLVVAGIWAASGGAKTWIKDTPYKDK